MNILQSFLMLMALLVVFVYILEEYQIASYPLIT